MTGTDYSALDQTIKMKCRLFRIAVLILSLFSCRQQDTGWQVSRGNAESNCYSPLDQINTNNVKDLKVAWTYNTGDTGAAIQCNPIIVDGIMYVTSPALKVIALEASNGKMLWQFDPFKEGHAYDVNRGVTYWQHGKDKRILFTAGHNLYALNAQTGQIIPTFGKEGTIDLREGLDRDPGELFVTVTSPGIIFNDLLILGSRTTEAEGGAPGHVRAFNVLTGKEAWVFHTIPQPGEFGYDTWEKDAWKNVGGANTWSGLSLDEKRGMVFFGTGSCTPDFFGGDRKGQNLFANSVIALKAASGERVWHYQIVHHDLLDYDLPAPPVLVTVNHDGKKIDAVAQITKTGNVFVFDRDTGKPLFDIEERKVPVSDIEGEESWPTQPFPVKPAPFVRQKYTEDDIPDISAEARAYVIERLKHIRNEGIFTPSSEQGSLVFPGFRGGAEWNGGSFDPQTGILYVNANEIPNITALKKVEADRGNELGVNLYQLNCATCHGFDRKGQDPFPSLLYIGKKMTARDVSDRIKNGKGQMPAFPNLSKEQTDAIVGYLFQEQNGKIIEAEGKQQGASGKAFRYAHSGHGQFLDREGYPAVKPPWGTLSAINLNTGEISWQIPLGEYEALTKRGIPPTGTQNFGGTIVTAGGVIFVGATKDEKFRAIDKQTGNILWETKLPAGGYATPSTYEVNGKQYVVIAAGGGGKNDTKKGDSYVAFALPD